MRMKNDAKIEQEFTCQFKIGMSNYEQFDRFWFKHSKISKIFTLMGCPWSKYIMFDLKKYKEVMFDSTAYWCKLWRKTDFCFQKRHEEFEKFSPGTWKSQNLDFDGTLLNPI